MAVSSVPSSSSSAPSCPRARARAVAADSSKAFTRSYSADAAICDALPRFLRRPEPPEVVKEQRPPQPP